MAVDVGPLVEPWVVGLDEIDRADVSRAGGKGANLGELVDAGFAVPAGFVITTAAYRGSLEATAPSAAPGGPADAAAVALADVLRTLPVPEALTAAIRDRYENLGEGPVAVRSSATAEDLPGATFAGQQETYLNVIGLAAVLDAVRGCWASLWGERAMEYRRHRHLDAPDLGIAVVVQRMVDPVWAGVLFTANPTTGAREETIVDAGRGLGEAVVSGTVTPDHYVLDSATAAIRAYRPGRGEAVVRPLATGGVHTIDPSPEDRALPRSVLTELVSAGARAAAHFGAPQDLEWAWDGRRIWILQARPMTALPPPPVRLTRMQRRLGIQLSDYLTTRPFPLDLDAWALPALGRMVSRMLREFAGVRVDLADMLVEQDGVVERFVPRPPRPTPAVLTAPVRLTRRVRRFDPAAWTGDARLTRFHGAVRRWDGIPVESLGWAQLMSVPGQVHELTDLISDLRVDYLPRVAFDLARLRLALALRGRGRDLGELITGGPTRTEDANQALAALADRARSDPALLEVLTTTAPEDLPAAITAKDFPEFTRGLTEFLAEYGHRETLSPLLASAPTWGEDPVTVWGMIAVLVDGPGDRSVGGASSTPPRSPRVPDRLAALVSAARSGVAFREDTHFELTRQLPLLRRALLEAGRRLVAVGVLDEAYDVFHLRLAELVGTEDPDRWTAAERERLRETVRHRARRRTELAGVPMLPLASLAEQPDGPDVLVTGAAASGGRATGAVRVITEPSAFGRLRSGEVLVCPYTNPSWTPLFRRAAAVVVDSGGVASHAAIVAREYGIPAVMGTGNATDRLTDGQRVAVDGDRGQVRRAPGVATVRR